MGIFDKLMDTMHLGNDYEDDYDDYDDDFDDEPEPRGSLFKKKDKKYDYDLGDDGASGSEKVKPVKQQPARIMPMRSKKGAALLNGCTVVLNFEGLDVEIAQRIIDFTSGSCYAIGGNLQKVSNYIFIVTPKSVDISGDFQEILSGAFDIPTI